MNIAIDSRSINIHSGSGIGTYTNNLVFNLIHNNTDEFTLFWAEKVSSKFVKKNTKIYQISNHHSTFYDKYYIPNILNKENIDIYHIPQNGIGFPFNINSNIVVTIHDLIPYTMPETVGKSYLKRFLKDMPNIINEAAGIITVSEYSKKDILRFFPEYPPNKIFVTPLAANNNYIPLNKIKCREYLKNIYGIDKPFILYIGGFSSRKNVSMLIDCFNKIKTQLKETHCLVLGGSLKDEGKKLQDYCTSLGLNDLVIFPGYIPDKIIPIFYNACKCFVYPSLYEGFGLPPLEAMSCCTAVITSNTTSIPEVTGNSALLIDPYNLSQLEQSIITILNDSDARNELAQNGYKKSLQYSWRLTAKKTLSAYKNIMLTNN